MNIIKITRRKIIKHRGELNLAGHKLPCFVLEDGTRVLSLMNVQLALKMLDEDDKRKSGTRFGRHFSQKLLEPIVDEHKKNGHNFDPIICYLGNKKINGFEATVFVNILKVFSEAERRMINERKFLPSRLKIIAEQCRILLDSFAVVGIIALIDEATGYQCGREKDELQKQLDKILGLYVLDKPQKWEKIFPWTFYKQIFRLYNLPFTVENIKRPGFIGTLTNKYIYGNLPKGVLEKLKKETPRGKGGNYKHRLHQLLTTEVGREDARKIIYSIETLFSISEDMEEFKKLEAKYHLQKELLYADLNLEAKDDNRIARKENLDKLLDACINTPPITLKQLQKELKEEREIKDSAKQTKQNSKDKKDSE
jgi:hypothetical protein